ncbi:hypothetical protein [Motilimonas pumila]|uniref:Uncharacterized protein n=1 Tax=Motilimonas pumila TaxID=2303987 RepID=A0A418YJP1_9GAMM|nr:hypothetical protein [Motilimonas pumila]RJG51188.1 hypothetical protein D1Z90_00140 [Motilimonas pumila]
MKYLLLLIITASGTLLYQQQPRDHAPVSHYAELIERVKVGSVSQDEVKQGVKLLAEDFCNDDEFQQTTGSNTQECLQKLASYDAMCTKRIFADAPQDYEEKQQIAQFAKRYTHCVDTL